MPAKVPQSIKNMVEGALRDVGGQKWLARQAEENPVAFMGLLSRVLPLQLASSDNNGNPITLHLIAAQIVSQELQRQLETQQQTPPTINGELDKLQTQPSWIDEPPPEE